MNIDDISPNGTEFLVVDLSSEDPYTLWRVPAPSGPPQPVGEVRTGSSKWSPNGGTIAYALHSDLYLANIDGSNSTKVASLPGEPIYLQWSPNGRHLRFSVVNPKGPGTTLWQADFPPDAVRPLLPDWGPARHPLAGGWTPDGRYFFFSAFGAGNRAGDSTRDIWTMREQEGWLRVNPRPVEPTAGPLNFYEPTPSRDGKSIFAVGEQLRAELMRYDLGSRQFVPYAHGISADHVAFSRDGQWMAYVKFPKGVLMRSRVDGSERRQLTFPPMHVFNPQWSPDGLQLAIQASARPGAPNKMYLISRDGGLPVLATEEMHDQQVYPSCLQGGIRSCFRVLMRPAQIPPYGFVT
jgi:Tol biopolymer transport system component